MINMNSDRMRKSTSRTQTNLNTGFFILSSRKTLHTSMSTDIEENGIEKIEEAELSFHVFYSDNWKELVDTPSQTFTFN